MAGGYFFQPRRLENLSRAELSAYARHCAERIDDGSRAADRLQGQLDVLGKGVTRDRWLSYGGLGLAVVGVVTTAIFTPLGLVALAGGAISLAGVQGTMSRDIDLRLVTQDLRDRRRAVAFCRSEMARIEAELDARRGGP